MSQSVREKWDIYDASGVPKNKTIFRGESLAADEYHLVVQIWLRNSRGEYLIQRRSAELAHLPNLWTTTAGHVVSGETAKEGAIREAEEELGVCLQPDNVQLLHQMLVRNMISTAWFARCDVSIDDVRFQETEVSAAKWADEHEIKQMIEAGKFFDYGNIYLAKVFAAI